jgi:hypothetical protein
MSEPENKPPEIKVTDRRRVEREPEPAPAPAAAEPAPPAQPRMPQPPVDFTTFILSFASTALIQMGAAPDPETNKSDVDLELARQTIDLLGMLREKTRGNLSDEETRIFDAMLYDLRVQFVEFSKKRS